MAVAEPADYPADPEPHGPLDPEWGAGLEGYTVATHSPELAGLGAYGPAYELAFQNADAHDYTGGYLSGAAVPEADTWGQEWQQDPGRAWAPEFETQDADHPDAADGIVTYPALEDMDTYERLAFEGRLDEKALAAARAVQERSGGHLREVLATFNGVDQADLARGLALEAGLGYRSLDGFVAAPDVVALVDEHAAVKHLFVPLEIDAGATVVAIADPFDPAATAALRRQLSGPLKVVVSTAGGILDLLDQAHAQERVRIATRGLAESRPDDSAAVVITRAQKLFGLGVIVLLAVTLVLAPLTTVIVINGLASLVYAGAAIFRLRLISLAADRDPSAHFEDWELDELDDRELPVYTILVPMYKEAAVVPMIGQSLTALDYPAHKLDVLMICEEDDDETIEAVKNLRLGSQFRLVTVPDSQPKTKPKACNYALAHARGEMVVIFDAEDAPEPDQLKRVLLALRSAPPEVVCVQAKLDYANSLQNLLTRSFTVEYAMWFDLILPGLEVFDAPIPLGGTSNHFRMEVLRELGGWDPFNVTEDADLGVRLYKRGYKTLIVDSVTYEEANSQVPNWIRQRSRWVKGHIQTWLVHMRNPLRLHREIGTRAFFAFQATIGASFFAALVNPIYWVVLLLWFATHAGLIRSMFPGVVYHAAAINLLVWNFAFVYAAAAGVARRGYFDLVRSAIYSPFYWILISIAAWKGAIQLVTKPFYWEKTEHGLADLSAHQPTRREPSRGG